ncbi:hypothetical protein VIGAN_03225900 [Vigna angularis var. angularis]|uniref:Pentatricopeptide repeat-containing protein n=1 Tax=Vigna angularis var. angularis TaxID=157739 RepID=A0A0S3RNW3_PHAAN|nr:hypothetical protein VIGAN_03225900 [Vigna angularis var. angularis]
MCRHGLVPDHVTLTTLLSGFTEFESVNEVAQVQTHVVKLGYDSTLKVCNSLLDSYCKTRSLGLVCHLFKHMPERDNVTFNVLLTGYSKEGFNHDAINLFSRCRIWGSIPLSLLLLLSTPNFVRIHPHFSHWITTHPRTNPSLRTSPSSIPHAQKDAHSMKMKTRWRGPYPICSRPRTVAQHAMECVLTDYF